MSAERKRLFINGQFIEVTDEVYTYYGKSERKIKYIEVDLKTERVILNEIDQIKYSCYHKSRKLCECDGQATYQAEVVDKIVSDFMLKLFKEIKGAPQEERLKKIYKNKMAGNTARIKKLETGIAKDKKQLNILKLEIANCLVGNSAFSQSDLSEAMNTLRSRIDEAESQIKSLREDESYQERAMRKILPSFNQFKSWAEEFETATLKQKKMIACQLFKRIEVGKGYNINFEINLTYAEFFNNWESTKELIEQVG